MMIEGIKAALDFAHDPERLRFVCFLTDGYIGNESEILPPSSNVSARRASSASASVVAESVSDEQHGALGRGAVAYLGEEDDGAA